MKKTLLFLISVLIAFTTTSQITAIPDNNFEQVLIDLGIDTNPTINGEIPIANINNITTLNIDSSNISDLTGIEDFLDLQTLYCNDNNLGILNMNANTALKYLYCNSNELTSLIVNTNTALIELYCNNNQLTTLNLSTNTDLKILFCNDNELTSLNVTANTALIFLFCTGNKLTSLNATNIVALEALKCNNNILTSLDLRNGNNNPTLTSFEATNNPNLICILVDDAFWSATNWTNIDATTSFVNNEAECATLKVEDTLFGSNLTLYPNPSKHLSIINLGKSYTDVFIKVLDAIGKTVNEFNFSNIQHVELNTSNYNKGLYFIKIKTQNNTATLKLLVE